jgi:hypothetical protein
MRAWHFVRKDGAGRPILRDGREVRVGKTYTHDGPVRICESGLHASARAIDALKYAPGSVVCLVECTGIEAREDDKFVCRERKVLAMADAERLLYEFACDCAQRALERYGERLTAEQMDACLTAIDMRLAWLQGLADDEMLGESARAAYAAYAGAYADAASAYAYAASAYAAADSAAYAAYAASATDERAMQNDELERRLMELLDF